MHAMLRHIDCHLDQPLDLARAGGGGVMCHPFHFHRVFLRLTGENLMITSRRRLTLAPAGWA